jgi:hypothetical protein
LPRYFFHVADGTDYRDFQGTVLVDVPTARSEAIKTATEMLKDRGVKLLGAGEWCMTVLDETGATVCRLRFSAD